MKITLNKKEFLSALIVGGTFAGKTKTLPITDCVKLKIKGNKMRIVSTDMENAMSYNFIIPDNSEEVLLCVDAKDLLNYTRLVKDPEITLVYEDNMITLKHKKGKSQFPTVNADSFPEIKNVGEVTKIKFPADLLNNWIVDARNYVSNDSLRPQMGSIYFYCQDGEFGACGSDGHLLYWNHSQIECQDFEFKLNKNAFGAVCKLCADSEEVAVEISENNVKFIGSSASVLARQDVSRYPNFKSVIPKNNIIVVEADKNEMIESITRCKLSANSVSPVVKLIIDGMNMSISCEDMDFNKKSTENIMVSSNGNITIGFNSDFLLTLLNTIEGARVKMCFSGPETAMIAREVSYSNKLLLQMPVQLK